MRRKLLIVCIVLLLIACFGHGGPIRRLTLEDGSSLAIREADLLKLFKKTKSMSDYSIDFDETEVPIEEKIDIINLMHKPRFSLRPPSEGSY